MGIAKLLDAMRFFPGHKLLELYPPFFFMGVKILEVSPDYRFLRARLPLRWYGKNLHGTMFGGFMCAVSDPLPALLCSRIFPDASAWTEAHYVKFRRPGKGALELRLEILPEDIELIRLGLEEKGKVSYTFNFAFYDKRDKVIADIQNTVFLRSK